MSRRASWILAGAVLLLLWGSARRAPTFRPGPAPVDPLEDLERERSRARAALAAGTPRELDRLRLRLASACEALADHPATPPGRAERLRIEAAARLRAAGEPRARVLWRSLAGTASPGVRDRARLELAHAARREGAWQVALARYEELETDLGVARRLRERATWWRARVHELRGAIRDAERTWRRLARTAADPCTRVRAWDRLGRSLLRRGAREEARRVLEECDRDVASIAAERTPTGAEVRRLLDAMSSRRALEAPPPTDEAPVFSPASDR